MIPMRKLLVIAAALLCICSAASAQKKVVIETTLGNDVEESLKSIFMSALSTGLTNSGQYTVLANREEYAQKLAGEIAAQASGLISDDQLIDFGNALGADMIVFVKIDAFDGQYFITVRMFDAQTGVADKTIDPILTTRSEVVQAAFELAKRMTTGGITGEAPKVTARDIYSSAIGCHIEDADHEPMSFSAAQETCRARGDGWRLPTVSELETIYYDQLSYPSKYGKTFKKSPYWSSSKRNNFSIWSVNFSSGSRTYVSAESTCGFSCVRAND